MKRDHATTGALSAAAKKVCEVLRQVLDAGDEARCRDMQREIRRVISQSDGHLSDETERRITQRLYAQFEFLVRSYPIDPSTGELA